MNSDERGMACMKDHGIPATVERCYLEPKEPLKVFSSTKRKKHEGYSSFSFSELTNKAKKTEKDPIQKQNNCAFDAGSSCLALIQKRCVFCHFFQTQEQLERGRMRAKSRLKYLGLDKKYGEI